MYISCSNTGVRLILSVTRKKYMLHQLVKSNVLICIFLSGFSIFLKLKIISCKKLYIYQVCLFCLCMDKFSLR